MGAQPRGAPGWPLLAFSTVSTARRRRVSTESLSREESARMGVMMALGLVLSLNCVLQGWNGLVGVYLDFHIVPKPGVLLGPAKGPFHRAPRFNVGAEPGAAQPAARRDLRCPPA